VAHLGGGASVCGMRDGASVSCSMGVSALDGLLMATRSGSVDPGLLLYLLEKEGLTVPQMRTMLCTQSGLLGVSGLSGDMRVLVNSDSTAAKDAIALFVQRASREIVAIATDIGGFDALVLTGGIGEHQASIRGMICEQLRWMGIRTMRDLAPPHAGSDYRISADASEVPVWVVHTDEESVMAKAAFALLSSTGLEPAS
jgi:acetate kinase